LQLEESKRKSDLAASQILRESKIKLKEKEEELAN
jgi:hypothetical protein